MIHNKKPEGFKKDFISVGALFVDNNKNILLLKRKKDNTYGAVAGKPKDKESVYKTLKRESLEETGIDLKSIKKPTFKKWYVVWPTGESFIFHLAVIHFDQRPNVTLDPKEHTNYRWVSFNEAVDTFPLIRDMKECMLQVKKLI